MDVVITDMTMPELTGIDLAREVRKFRSLPIVVATGYSDQVDETSFRRHGIDRYLRIQSISPCFLSQRSLKTDLM